jgi:hypothetical protein
MEAAGGGVQGPHGAVELNVQFSSYRNEKDVNS